MSIMRRSSLGDLASKVMARASLGRVAPSLLVCLSILLLVFAVAADGRTAPTEMGGASGAVIQMAVPDVPEPASRSFGIAAIDAEEVAGDPWQGASAHAGPSNLDAGRRLPRPQIDLASIADGRLPERPPRLAA
ncbi:hypothetical protein [Methylobacterium iners]|uniref:Uncharacterized protein n=1 Tax=Methylobacterium iners TaxID=418707 RepID=A0ABQ4RTC8_9HYPH|nr:hypothetical protein [Methylobacterium iners]GJD92969.1 hypothetical protein OCOJLMKI_0153 [Methylobacterium iners]